MQGLRFPQAFFLVYRGMPGNPAVDNAFDPPVSRLPRPMFKSGVERQGRGRFLNMQDRGSVGQPFGRLEVARRARGRDAPSQKPSFVLSCSAKKEPKKAARRAGASPAWPGRERAQHIALIRSPAPPMRRPGKRGGNPKSMRQRFCFFIPLGGAPAGSPTRTDQRKIRALFCARPRGGPADKAPTSRAPFLGSSLGAQRRTENGSALQRWMKPSPGPRRIGITWLPCDHKRAGQPFGRPEAARRAGAFSRLAGPRTGATYCADPFARPAHAAPRQAGFKSSDECLRSPR